MISFPIIRVVTKLLIPYILLFGCYVQLHGDYGPGGGFQAGVIIAAGLILYGLVFGIDEVQRVASPQTIERLMAAGVLLFASTGVATMIGGENFLDYDALDHPGMPAWLPTGQHLGILLIEIGVGVTVASVMTIIFYVFASRGRRP